MILANELQDKDVQEFLEHYGKKGMHWGQRKSRSELRSLNKASRKKDRDKFDRQIDRARSRTTGTTRAARLGLTDTGSKSHTEYKQARAKYKQEKYIIGRREAKKALNKAAEKRMNDIQTSQYAKSGKERAVVIAAVVAGISLQALASANR